LHHPTVDKSPYQFKSFQKTKARCRHKFIAVVAAKESSGESNKEMIASFLQYFQDASSKA
jgi:hypothetical protein